MAIQSNYLCLHRDLRALINAYLKPEDLLALSKVSHAFRQAVLESGFHDNVWDVFQARWGYRVQKHTGISLALMVIDHIFGRVRSIKPCPPFIQRLIDSPLNLSLTSLRSVIALLKWCEARDTIILWQGAAAFIEETGPQLRLPSIKDTVEKASEFGKWVLDHRTGFDKWLNAFEITLSRRQLTTLPDAVSHISFLKPLRSLNLSHNKLTILPEVIGNFTGLRTLELGHNGLSTLPSSITKLTCLNNLDLQSNPLVSLPNSIGQMPLSHLILSWEQSQVALPVTEQLTKRNITVTMLPLPGF